MKLNGLDITYRDVAPEFDSIEGHGRVCILGAHRNVERATVEDAGAFLAALDERALDRACLRVGRAKLEAEDFEEPRARVVLRWLFSEQYIREQAGEWINDR